MIAVTEDEASFSQSQFSKIDPIDNNSSNNEKDNNNNNNNNNVISINLSNNINSNSMVSIPRARTSSIENVQLNNEIKIDKDMLSTNSINQRITLGPQHFDLLKLVGEGAFGKVIMVKNIIDGNLYAMKIITKKLLKKKNHILYMKAERDILTKIKHPFIVSLQFAFQTGS
jgi:hypothetical protein